MLIIPWDTGSYWSLIFKLLSFLWHYITFSRDNTFYCQVGEKSRLSLSLGPEIWGGGHCTCLAGVRTLASPEAFNNIPLTGRSSRACSRGTSFYWFSTWPDRTPAWRKDAVVLECESSGSLHPFFDISLAGMVAWDIWLQSGDERFKIQAGGWTEQWSPLQHPPVFGYRRVIAVWKFSALPETGE